MVPCKVHWKERTSKTPKGNSPSRKTETLPLRREQCQHLAFTKNDIQAQHFVRPDAPLDLCIPACGFAREQWLSVCA